MSIADRCRELAEQIAAADPPPMTIMEVCGTHSHAIGRYGIRQLLPERIRLISGPGCPVCVTADSDLDAIAQIADQGAVIATFGDMVRVIGPRGSLADARAAGADVRVMYSPMQSLDLAREYPDREVVLIGVGFETTTPTIAVTVSDAASAGLRNFSVYACHKLVPPALEALITDPDCRIDALLCPGHVSTIIGADAYGFIPRDHALPCAIAGFTPLDILLGVNSLVNQTVAGEPRVENCYPRAVQAEGNPKARAQVESVFSVADVDWRGLGMLHRSGLALRAEYSHLDARARFAIDPPIEIDRGPCICGEVLQGKALPTDCPAFGSACTPQSPIGPCMVSSEGSCAAAYRYGG